MIFCYARLSKLIQLSSLHILPAQERSHLGVLTGFLRFAVTVLIMLCDWNFNSAHFCLQDYVVTIYDSLVHRACPAQRNHSINTRRNKNGFMIYPCILVYTIELSVIVKFIELQSIFEIESSKQSLLVSDHIKKTRKKFSWPRSTAPLCNLLITEPRTQF